ncbi:MAG: SDR family NAD(P)-dependent oxidoreductase [Lachnospiraceae bacterium]|nr:SDR family NAD(P)-dependent oxidoreductase [Lachnospiraceae bacterium]
MVVAVLGAYGGIGQSICRKLFSVGDVKIKASGRRLEEAKHILSDIWDEIQYENVDIDDEKALEEFVSGVQILINAAGIDGQKEMDIIRQCQKADVRYISPGKANPLAFQKNCIFDAGSMPGLSLLIPRAMAGTMDEPVVEVNFYYCVQDSFSKNAAKDYIEGLFDCNKKMMVIYENGKLIPFVEKSDFEIPYLEGKKKRYPFYDQESKIMVREFALKRGSWSMVLEGQRTMKALEESRTIYPDNQELAIEKLCKASSLDTFEHGRYSAIYVQMKTESRERRCFVRCNTSSELTALASVLCVELIKRAQLENFCGSFGELRNPENVIGILQKMAAEVIWESDAGKTEELLAGEI